MLGGPAPAGTKHLVWASISERQMRENQHSDPKGPLDPGLGQGFNFSQAYLQKPPEAQAAPAKERKQKHMRRKEGLRGEMNPQSHGPPPRQPRAAAHTDSADPHSVPTRAGMLLRAL